MSNSSTERNNWEKHVDKEAEKFRIRAEEAVYLFRGSTYSSEAAYVLAAAYAELVKDGNVAEAEKKIFTQEFLSRSR